MIVVRNGVQLVARVGATTIAGLVLAGCETLPNQGRSGGGDVGRAVQQSLGNILGQGGKNILTALSGTCSTLKSWASSAGPTPTSPQPALLLPFVQDAVFEKHFGKRYDQLTVADFKVSQRDQLQCRRDGTLTPAEQQLVQRVWSQGSQPVLVALLQQARSEREASVALADELDRLPATEQGYARLEEIRQPRQRQRSGATSTASEGLAQKIKQAEERIAPVVFKTRVDRALSESAQPSSLPALVQLDGQVRAARLADVNSGPLLSRLQGRVSELDAQAARQERASSPLLRESVGGLESVATAKQWMVQFQERYRASLAGTPALRSLWSEAQELRSMQLERAQASLSEQIGQAKSAAELDNLTGRYLASGEATGSAGALLAQVATQKETISQAERNRQIFGAQVPAQATTAANSRPAVQTHRCDQLAADPDDPTRVTAGVADEAIKSAQAIAACTEALKTHANEPRFAFQLGRALLAGGKETAAVQSFAAAAQAGHAGAMVYFGMAMAEGAGGLPKEPEKGEQMQALGERAGYRSGQPIAAPTPDQTNVAAAKGSTAAGSVPGKYNMPHIVQAIYLGDASKLDKDAKTNASYLLSQARMLAGDPTCRAFLQKDVDAWSVKQARGLVKAVRPEDMLNNWLRGMEAVVKNPTEAAINIGASEQHYASLENYAASDMMEFVQQVGPCNSPKFNRYVANLKSYLDSGTTAGK